MKDRGAVGSGTLNSNRERAGNPETKDFATSAWEMHYSDPSAINRFKARTSYKHSQTSSLSRHCHPLQQEIYYLDGSECGLDEKSSLNRAGDVAKLGQHIIKE